MKSHDKLERKKVLFVVPPKFKGRVPERVYGCSYTLYNTPNLGILYAAAVLEKQGHDVQIIDDENLRSGISGGGVLSLGKSLDS